MIGRLFGQSAEPLEELSGATPIHRDVLKTLGHLTETRGKRIKTVGDASAHMREAYDTEEVSAHTNAYSLSRLTQDMEGRQMGQMAMIMSTSLDDERKTKFLGSLAQAGGTGLIEEMISQKDPVACAADTLALMADRASAGAQSETFSALKAQGAEHKNTELYVTIKAKDFGAARAHLAAGADATALCENGNTVLHAAGHAHIASLTDEIVREAGPDLIHVRNDDGKSFLSMALDPAVGNELDSWGRPRTRNYDIEKMIDMAQKNDFDFTKPDNDGNTLLHYFAACRRDFHLYEEETGPRFNIERKLAAQGIDMMAKNNAGQTAGDIALAQNDPEVSAILAGNGYLPSTEEGMEKVFENSFKTGRGHALKRMEEQGVDWVDRMGGPKVAPFEVILRAAKERSPKPIEAARTAGLSFDVRNEKGETPFSIAHDMCNADALDVLKEVKMDIVAADLSKKTQTKVTARDEKAARRKPAEGIR